MTNNRLMLLVTLLTLTGCERPTTAPAIAPAPPSLSSEDVMVYEADLVVDVAPDWYASATGTISTWGNGARVEVKLFEYAENVKLRETSPAVAGGMSILKFKSSEWVQANMSVTTDCGRNYRGHGTFRYWWEVPTLGELHSNEFTIPDRKDLPVCDCFSETTLVDNDPYSSADDCDTTSSGSAEGSGISYDEGDYTNGETVNWTTGTGDGGVSACGVDARVVYVCIDYYDEDGVKLWTSCGYATTC